MSKRGYRVSSVIVCEDIRQEANGKQILIGVFSGDIIVGTIPANLTQLSFRFDVNIEHKDFHKVYFMLTDPSRNIVFDGQRELQIHRADMPLTLAISVPGLRFIEAGVYSVKLGLDHKPRKVMEFTVRLPQSDEEATRLPN